MRAVIGYEEKDPEITRHLSSGYPRFIVHPYTRQLAALLVSELKLSGSTLWLASSARAADGLAAHLGSHATRIRHDGLQGVAHREDRDLAARAKSYLQHTGGFLSSREAEDHLVRRGVLKAVSAEQVLMDDPRATVLSVLRQAYPRTEDRDLILAHTGMSAFYSAWRALVDLQTARGRTIWIQLGWLYLDTIALLRKFAPNSGDYLHVRNACDLSELRSVFARHGNRIAGIVMETPTNPLVQTPDVAAIATLARQHGARIIIDPTLASPFNVEVLPHADVVVNSLTKYAGNEGDIIAGAIIINPDGHDADALRARCAAEAEPLYHRDLARLAAEIGEYEHLVMQTNASVRRIAAHLEAHPRIREVFWTLQPSSRENYLKIARSPEHVGAVLSFSLRMPLADFYDRIRLPKGPSFGMKTTLICPFIYLAHYDLVTSESGRAELAASGLDPELLRLSVGCEPVDDIIAALDEALA